MDSSGFNRLRASRSIIRLVILGLLLTPALPSFAQHGRPEVSLGDHAVSPPVRDLPTNTELPGRRIKPLHIIPPAGPASTQVDGALQTSSTAAVATTAGLNFAGAGKGDYGFTPDAAPPDTNGAVGATQYVQWVNESFAVFSKSTGTIAVGFPKAGNSLWSGFGGGCETNNDGDPIVQYDKAAN